MDAVRITLSFKTDLIVLFSDDDSPARPEEFFLRPPLLCVPAASLHGHPIAFRWFHRKKLTNA